MDVGGGTCLNVHTQIVFPFLIRKKKWLGHIPIGPKHVPKIADRMADFSQWTLLVFPPNPLQRGDGLAD